MRRLILVLPLLMAAAPPIDNPGLTADEVTLRAAKVPTDGPRLLAYLRTRYTEVSQERIRELIEEMGEDSWYRREDATLRLISIGASASRQLEAARKHEDLEIRWRANRCLSQIFDDSRQTLALHAAAIRHIARLRPAGAVPVLLICLAAAEDDAIAAEMQSALLVVGIRDGVADPAIVPALTSRSGRVRAAVAFLIGQAKLSAHYEALRKLFDDPEAPVRHAAAVALLEAGKREGVEGLIAETGRPASRESSLAEDLLLRLAGDKAPTSSGTDEPSRRKYRQGWEKWWKEHGEKVDLDILAEYARTSGYTTVVLLDRNEIIDLDGSNRVRFTITGLEMPLDVQRLARDRVMVAEHAANRVTERNSRGEIVWEYRLSAPLVAQRLPNGNTFMANREGLVEVDPKGNEVWTYNRPIGEQIMRARRLPNGDTLMITTLGVARFVRIDRAKRETANFGVEVYTSGGRIDLTPEGNVLIPELHNRRVVERNMEGTIVREIKVEQPITALVLPGGNVLITSMTEKRAFELDRTGKEVWEYKRESRVTRAVRP